MNLKVKVCVTILRHLAVLTWVLVEEENLVKEAEELAATTKRKTQKSKEPHKLRPRKKDVQYMFG